MINGKLIKYFHCGKFRLKAEYQYGKFINDVWYNKDCIIESEINLQNKEIDRNCI